MPDMQSLLTLFSGALPLLVIVAIAAYSIRILREYERGVVFLLGRFWKVKGPGPRASSCPSSSRWCAWTCARACSTCRRRT